MTFSRAGRHRYCRQRRLLDAADVIVRVTARPRSAFSSCMLAYNLADLMRTLVLPEAVAPWSPTSLGEKPIKIGARIVTHGRRVTFQLAEVAVPRGLLEEILRLIARPPPPPAPA